MQHPKIKIEDVQLKELVAFRCVVDHDKDFSKRVEQEIEARMCEINYKGKKLKKWLNEIKSNK